MGPIVKCHARPTLQTPVSHVPAAPPCRVQAPETSTHVSPSQVLHGPLQLVEALQMACKTHVEQLASQCENAERHWPGAILRQGMLVIASMLSRTRTHLAGAGAAAPRLVLRCGAGCCSVFANVLG